MDFDSFDGRQLFDLDLQQMASFCEVIKWTTRVVGNIGGDVGLVAQDVSRMVVQPPCLPKKIFVHKPAHMASNLRTSHKKSVTPPLLAMC